MSSVTNWLLGSTDPSIRFLTLTEVLAESPRSAAARAAKLAIPEGPRVRALLSRQRKDGGFGVHAYAKWTGGFWRLAALAELALPSGHQGLNPLVDHVFEWLQSGGGRPAAQVGGRWRVHATQDGYGLAALSVLGFHRDRRARLTAESLMRWQWPDGGWNCDIAPSADHSSFHETHGPVWGLAELWRRTGQEEVRRAADKAAELLLEHRLFRSNRTGGVIHPAWLRVRFPPYWHYDILQGLWVLARLDKVSDPRAAEALGILEGKRRSDGTWHSDGYWWKPPGSSGPNVEVVDWGRGGPNEWMTLRALRVLKAANRIVEDL